MKVSSNPVLDPLLRRRVEASLGNDISRRRQAGSGVDDTPYFADATPNELDLQYAELVGKIPVPAESSRIFPPNYAALQNFPRSCCSEISSSAAHSDLFFCIQGVVAKVVEHFAMSSIRSRPEPN